MPIPAWEPFDCLSRVQNSEHLSEVVVERGNVMAELAKALKKTQALSKSTDKANNISKSPTQHKPIAKYRVLTKETCSIWALTAERVSQLLETMTSTKDRTFSSHVSVLIVSHWFEVMLT